MFVGYTAGHARNTFKMLNLDTKRIWQSRAIRWLAPSLPAYATLQLAPFKAGKSNEDDDNDEPQVKTNPPPLKNQADDHDDVEDNNANEQDDDLNNEDDEEDDHLPAPNLPLSPSQCQGYPCLKTVVYLLQSYGNKLCLPASPCG